MALTVTPGPLPDDGTRIDPEVTLRSFVQGTTIQGFSADAFGQSQIGFVYAATDPPASSVRTKATRWFRRGEGVTYRWDVLSQSGVTYGDWVAVSNRKEALVRLRYQAPQFATLWHTQQRQLNPQQAQCIQIDNLRQTMVVEATHPTLSRTVPPFWVAASDHSGYSGWIVARVLGYTNMLVANPAASAGLGCYGASDSAFDWRVIQPANPYTYTNAAYCSIVGSSASNPTRLAFLWGSVSHLLSP